MSGLSVRRLPMMPGVIKCPSSVARARKISGATSACVERCKGHEADHEQCGLHHQRPDIWNEIQYEGEDRPGNGIRQSG